MLDFSFTQNPEWREKRVTEWEKLRKGLAEEFSRKQLEVYERYFLNGVETEYKDTKIRSGSLIYLCPKIDREAWVYFLTQRYPINYNEPANFAQKNYWQGFVDSVLNTINAAGLPTGWSQEEYLDLFDFILGKTFSPVVESSFPIGQNQVIGVAKVKAEKLFTSILKAYLPWFRADGRYPFLWVHNLPYLQSIIGHLQVSPIQKAINDLEGEEGTSDIDKGVKFLKQLITYHKGLKPISGNADEVAKKTQALNDLLAVFKETEPFEGAYEKLYGLVE